MNKTEELPPHVLCSLRVTGSYALVADATTMGCTYRISSRHRHTGNPKSPLTMASSKAPFTTAIFSGDANDLESNELRKPSRQCHRSVGARPSPSNRACSGQTSPKDRNKKRKVLKGNGGVVEVDLAWGPSFHARPESERGSRHAGSPWHAGGQHAGYWWGRRYLQQLQFLAHERQTSRCKPPCLQTRFISFNARWGSTKW